MKILLDHCVPRPFEKLFPEHQAIHTSRLGWGALENGKLLTAAEEAGFQALVTVDRSMQFQQSMSGRKIAVIYLLAQRNDLASLTPLAEMVTAQFVSLQPGSTCVIKAPDWRES